MVATQTLPMASTETNVIPVRAGAGTQARLAYVDNLRILLVVLVILFHLAITYGGEGPWPYREGQAGTITATVLTLFVAVNQAFFMGFYFFLAAFFVPQALARKGCRLFLKERFQRLGLPLLFQLLMLGPLLSYLLGITVWGYEGPFLTYIRLYWQGYQGLDTGPLWFLEALLIFGLLYALWWRLAGPRVGAERRESQAPGNASIAVFALVVGLVTFVVRIWLPVGWVFVPLGFQFPHFPQYIALFVAGTIVYRRGWLSSLVEDAPRGRFWGRIAASMIALAPVLFVLGGALEGNTEAFRGGLHWQTLVYALWEQFLCVGVIIGLLGLFQRRYNRQGRLAREMSASAYAVYVFHAPVLVLVALGLRAVGLVPAARFALAIVISLPLCFLVGGLVRSLPLVRRIL